MIFESVFNSGVWFTVKAPSPNDGLAAVENARTRHAEGLRITDEAGKTFSEDDLLTAPRE
jgi:hypothetical protein